MKKLTRLKGSFWVVLLVGVTFGWFMWKSWQKLDSLFGGSNTPYYIAGGIVLVALLLGVVSFKRLAGRFT